MNKSLNPLRRLWSRLRKSGSSRTWLLFLPGRADCHLVHAEQRGGQLFIRQFVTVAAEELDEATRLPTAAILETHLQRFQISNPKVAVLLPRNSLSFARVPLPRMAASEVHETAMIQSEALFSESTGQPGIDYVLLPQEDREQSLLLIHGVDRNYLQRIVTHLQASQLQCSLVAPAAAIGCCTGIHGDDRLSILVVMPDKEKIDIFAQSHGCLLSHQRRRVPVESTEDVRNSVISGEVMRTISCLSVPGVPLTGPVIRFAANGRDWTAVSKSLQFELGLPAEDISVLPSQSAGTEHPELESYLHVIATGVQFESSGAIKSPLNFLSPRTCLSRKERRRRNLIRGGLVASLLCICLNVWSRRSVGAMEDELSVLTAELEQLQEQVDADADVFQIIDFVKLWKNDRADLQLHFSILQKCIPETSRCQLSDLQFHQQPDDPGILIIEISGLADRTETVVELSQNILRNGHFRQRPYQIERTNGSGNLKVNFRIELEPVTPETSEDTDELMDEVTDEMAEEVTEDVTGKSADEVTGEVNDNVTGEAAEKVSDKVAGETADKATDEKSVGDPQDPGGV
jgi:hypothetical protein